MTPRPLLSRRVFLADLGKGAFAVAVLGVAACTPSGGATARPSSASSSGSGPANGAAGSADAGGAVAASGSAAAAGSGAAGSGGLGWKRVNLGFVSAYLLARAGEIAIVDTGVAGSDDEIGAVIQEIGLGWKDVAHVILTHKHGDHAGSVGAGLTNAGAATGYIGAGDLAAVNAPRPLIALNDGDRVFDLRIIATPGHTVGHISVLDEAHSVLVAGDALRTDDGPLAGSNPQFTEDATAAKATLVKLGGLSFEALLPGHGEPILSGAAAQVKALASA